MRILAALLLVLAPAICMAFAGNGNTANDSYNDAKRMLEREVYYDHRETIYCKAPFDKNWPASPRFQSWVRAPIM